MIISGALQLFLSTDPSDRKNTLKLNPSVGCIFVVASVSVVSVVARVGGGGGETVATTAGSSGQLSSSPVLCVVVVVVTAITTAGPRAERRVESRERPRY